MLDQDDRSEAHIRAGRARMALCEALPAAMTAETGEEWIRIPYNAPARHRVGGTPRRYHVDGQYDDTPPDPNVMPNCFVGCTLCRARDGFEIDVHGNIYGYDSDNLFRMTAEPSFPCDPAMPERKTHIWQIPGYSRSSDLKTEFDATRPPKAIARQIARTILTPTAEAAFEAQLAALEKRMRAKDAKAAWLAALAEVIGVKTEAELMALGFSFQSRGPSGFFESAGPGGFVTISIPEGIEEMRAMIAALLPFMRRTGDQ